MKRTESRYFRDWALRNINFRVSAGEAFAIVGHNGSGKSTLLSLLLGTMLPDQGNIKARGKIASLLELGAGFHPELSGRDNVYLYGAILGMTLAEIKMAFDAIVQFSELKDAIDHPIRTYSNGMIARLGFSTIIHAPAEILLIDEVLAVGDNRFQEKCITFLREFKLQGGSLIIVSHDMGVLSSICESGMCLDRGEVAIIGTISQIVDRYGELLRLSS